MAGKQAKILSVANVAGEIAKLIWDMVLEAGGEIGHSIALHDNAAKKGSGRRIPLNDQLRQALIELAQEQGKSGAVISLSAADRWCQRAWRCGLQWPIAPLD